MFLGVGDLYPKFCKVVELIAFYSSYYIKLQECKTEFFEPHYNSFSVSFFESFHFCPIQTLPVYPVLHIRKLCVVSRLQFLTLKQYIEV